MYDFANYVYSYTESYHFSVGYSFYFVLGYYISDTEFTKKVERTIYVLGIIGFASTIILSRIYSYYSGSPDGRFYDNFTINVMLESIAVFTFAKYKVSKWIKTERQEKIVKKLSKYSFGIYLAHALFITILSKVGITTASFNPFLSVVVITILVFILSLIVSAILNKIPIINKYIV